MIQPRPEIRIDLRRARSTDRDRFEEIRSSAFAPVFASFKAILGDEIYERAQRHEDEAQEALLSSLFDDHDWQLFAAEHAGEVVGFVSIRLEADTGVGEIGLNAVDPTFAGNGLGTAMYGCAIDIMRDAGMAVATVATGGDPSHAPARRAYRKAGFDVEIPSVWMCRSL